MSNTVGLGDTYNEIFNQNSAWSEAVDVVISHQEQIQELIRNKSYSQITYTGCGSTYYLSLAIASLTQGVTKWLCRAAPASELVLNPESIYACGGQNLLVAISRSGETSETVFAVKEFINKNIGDVIIVSNYPERVLAQMGDLQLIIPSGQEKSVAQTRSFASMYIACLALSMVIAGRQDYLSQMGKLSSIGTALIRQYDNFAQKKGTNLAFDRYYFLGSGPRYGLACEASLKLKEMSLTHSEPFHFLEFRHGPISMVNDNTLVVGLLSEKNRGMEASVLDDVLSCGGSVFSLSETEADVCFNSGLPVQIRDVLYLPVLQLLAYYRARAKNLNPDQPKNLSAVVKLIL